MNSPPTHLHGLTRPELTALIAAWGFSPVHANRLWGGLYRDAASSQAELGGLPARLMSRLRSEAAFEDVHVTQATHSSDGLTQKYLLTYADGQSVESVLMRYRGRATACLSTQVGCALGCVFCATGQMGFSRNLTASEIVAQALFIARQLRDESGTETKKLSNIVLMGMGEPLQNYDAVMQAIEILTDSGGLAIGAKQITLSTVGVTPGIIRLADEGRKCSLAVSLHAATQVERAALLPIARAWPLEGLIEACHYYVARLDRRIFFEWALIAGQNDRPVQAEELGRLLQGLQAHVNLIPLNTTAGYAGAPADRAAADQFQAILKAYGLPSTVRQRRGIDIAAGCGQLAVAEPAGSC